MQPCFAEVQSGHPWCYGADSPYTATKVFWFSVLRNSTPTQKMTKGTEYFMTNQIGTQNSKDVISLQELLFQELLSQESPRPESKQQVPMLRGQRRRQKLQVSTMRASKLRVRSAWCFWKLPCREMWIHDSRSLLNFPVCCRRFITRHVE